MLVAGLQACALRGDGTLETELRTVPTFSAVEVFDAFTVNLGVDPSLSATDMLMLEVRGDGNAIDRLLTGVHGDNVLAIGVNPNRRTRLQLNPEVDATVPTLRRVHASDDAIVTVAGARDELQIEASRSAEIHADALVAAAVMATVADEAHVSIQGTGPSLELETSGQATVDASAFIAEVVKVDATGTGEVIVCATKAFTVIGSGAQQVSLRCGP